MQRNFAVRLLRKQFIVVFAFELPAEALEGLIHEFVLVKNKLLCAPYLFFYYRVADAPHLLLVDGQIDEI